MLRLFLCLLLLVAVANPSYALFMPPGSQKYTSDPNHKGFEESSGILMPVMWENYRSKCEACDALVKAYNNSMGQLLTLKYEREYLRRDIDSQEKLIKHMADLRNAEGDATKGTGGLSEGEKETAAKRLNKMMALDELKVSLRNLNQKIARFHNSAVDLWQQVLACQKQCKPENENGPSWVFVPNEHNAKNLPFDWKGPYSPVCQACAALAQRLNALPVMAIKEIAELQGQEAKKLIAETLMNKKIATDTAVLKGRGFDSERDYIDQLKAAIKAADKEIKRHKSNLDKMKKNFDQTLVAYDACVKKCPPKKTSAVIEMPGAEPAQNVSVANDFVVDDLQISPEYDASNTIDISDAKPANTPPGNAAVKASDTAGVPPNTTQDPNHPGWIRKGKWESTTIRWHDVSTDCVPCQSLVKQYNMVMKDLLEMRSWRRTVQEIHNNQDAEVLYDLQLSGSYVRDEKDIKAGEPKREARLDGFAKALGSLVENDKGRDEQLEKISKKIKVAENMAQRLRKAVADCEKQCGGGIKTTGIGVGGLPAITGADTSLPAWEGMSIDFPWKGPYPAKCPKCKPIADHLNKLYDLAQEQLVERESLKRLHSAGALLLGYEDNLYRLKENLENIKANFAESIKRYNYCIKKVCNESYGKTACAAPWGKTSITVGPNDKYGTGAELKSKAKGMAMGALGGMLGGGGKSMGGIGSPMGGSSQKDPPTEKDPVRDNDKVENEVENDDGDEVETAVGFTWGDDGNLLISAEIEDADQDGTFQTIFIDNIYGSRYRAFMYYLYEVYYKWKLTVSWTHDKYRNGEHIYHDEGKEITTGTEKVGSFEVFNFLDEESVIHEAAWNILGFGSALKGPKAIGAKFKITKQDFQTSPRMTVVVHVTQPENKQVDTIPLVYGLLYSGPLSGAFDENALKIYAMPKGDLNAVDANGTLVNDPCYANQSYWQNNQAGRASAGGSYSAPAIGLSLQSVVDVVDVVGRAASEAANDNGVVTSAEQESSLKSKRQEEQSKEQKKKKSLFNFNSGKKINRGAGND